MLQKVLGGLLLVCLFSCERTKYDQRHKVQIDNPTTEKITLTIDTMLIVLDPMTSDTMMLNPGDYTMQFRDSTFHFKLDGYFTEHNVNLLINPTRADYILKQYVYATQYHPPTAAEMEKELQMRMDSAQNRLPYDTIKVMDTFPVIGNYKKINDLFITDQQYDYCIDMEMPLIQKTMLRDSRVNKIKIFREKDLMPAIIKEETPYPTPHSI
jgi:hypothetical protein